MLADFARSAALAACFGLSACASMGSDREQSRRAEALVLDAAATVEGFAAAPEMAWLRENVDRAEAVLIAPQVLKGGFIFGGSGGNGVMVVRDGESWSAPAFYTLASATFGLQIGGEVGELVLLVMTDAGVDALLATEAKLGGDVSVTAGPVGAGAKAQTYDVLAFSRSKGLYGGINLEGSVVSVRASWNDAYYGQRLRPKEVFADTTRTGPHADALREALRELGD